MRVKITKTSMNFNPTISKGDSFIGELYQMDEGQFYINKLKKIQSLSKIMTGKHIVVKGNEFYNFIATTKIKEVLPLDKYVVEVETMNSIYLIERV